MARGTSKADIMIIAPGNAKVVYQDLAKSYAAIEPPIWASLLANFARKRKGYEVDLVDQEGLGLSPEQIGARAAEVNPKLVLLVVYGQQPSASSQLMTMATEVASQVRKAGGDYKIMMLGTHPSALPKQTLDECDIDFVCQGEGPATIDALLQLSDMNDTSSLKRVPGLWYRDGEVVCSNPRATLIDQKDLPTELPGMAWDLLPMDAYRAHNWHCFTHIDQRQPYASIYTSLGCPFNCSFCCINAPFDKHRLRCWSTEHILGELDTLAEKYNVMNIKIADEMFVLNERHVLDLCDGIIERGHKFNFWAYARVDTVKDKFLEKLKKAGVNWLCLGIESGSKHVRNGVEKGRFGQTDIAQTVKKIQDAGIYIIANYIFGMPDDSFESMQETLDMAVELNCEWSNFYSGMAYPGSRLYNMAVEKGWALPEKWQDFSQHSYEMLPLPTEHLEAGEVIAFRDRAWEVFHTNPKYHRLLKEKFGQATLDHVVELTQHKLRRKHALPLKVDPFIKTEGYEGGWRMNTQLTDSISVQL